MVNTSSSREEQNSNTTKRSIDMRSRNISKQNNVRKQRRDQNVEKKRNSRTSRVVIDSASTDSDISADEADAPQPTSSRLRSLVYEYADKLSDQEYRCNLCSKIVRCSKDSNGNIRRHLTNAHELTDLAPKNHASKVNKADISHSQKQKLDAAVIRCIIRDGRSFEDFRKSGMREFLSHLLAGYVGPSVRTVQRNIRKIYSNKLFELREELKMVKYVGLTTDLWKRPGRQHHYLGVTIHYVNNHFQNVSKILSFQRFHGRHFSKRIRCHLIRLIEKFDLREKIVAVVTDNGKDMRAAMAHSSIPGVWINCLAHSMNLIVQNGLSLWPKKKKKTTTTAMVFDFEDATQSSESEISEDADGLSITGSEIQELNKEHVNKAVDDESDVVDDDESYFPRDKGDLSSDDDMATDDEQAINEFNDPESILQILCRCRKIINVINKSSILYDFFDKLSQVNSNGGLILDMKVRWGSTFKMIRRLLDLRPMIIQTIHESSSLPGLTKAQAQALADNQLNDDEWSILQSLSGILEVFHNATEMLSGQKYPSLAIAYSVLDGLDFFLHSLSDDHIENSIKSLLQKSFNDYITRSTDSPVYQHILVSAYLNPCSSQLMNHEDKTFAKSLLISEVERTYDSRDFGCGEVPIHSSNQSTIKTLSTITISSNQNKLKNFRSKCGIISDGGSIVTKLNGIKQELYKYESLECSEHDNFETWWKKHSNALPLLSDMARRYGCLPATSVPSESSFSVAGHLVRKTRTSLTSKNLKYSMFLKDKL